MVGLEILNVFVEEFVRFEGKYFPFRFLVTSDRIYYQYVDVEEFLEIRDKIVSKQLHEIQFNQ